MPGVQQFRFADGHEHALGRGGVGEWIVLAGVEVFLDRQLVFTRLFVACQEMTDNIHTTSY
ncbi:hypothetical protein D9M68_973370 [compost metagenome]